MSGDPRASQDFVQLQNNHARMLEEKLITPTPMDDPLMNVDVPSFDDGSHQVLENRIKQINHTA